MAVTGIENVSADGELEGEGVSGGVGEDKAGKGELEKAIEVLLLLC